MNRKLGWTLATLALITACAAPTTSAASNDSYSTTWPAAPAAGDTAPVNTVQQVLFGTTFDYPTGVKVAIGEPQPFVPSPSATRPAGAARAVALKATVTNGSAGPLNLGQVSIQAAAGDEAVQRVFDAAKGVLAATQTLPPGAKQAFTVVFGVPAGGSDFRVQVQPGPVGYQPVFFTGKI
jgi:hypothetical protein